MCSYDLELLPTVEKVVPNNGKAFGFETSQTQYINYCWEGKEENVEAVPLNIIENGNEIFSLYRMHLLEGRLPKAGSIDEVMVNEEMIRSNGIKNPIGKMLSGKGDKNGFRIVGIVTGKGDKNGFRIVGIVQDAFIKSPTQPASPMLFTQIGRASCRERV